MKVTGLLGKLAKPILDKYQEARPQQGDRTLKEETFDIAGVSYYLDNLCLLYTSDAAKNVLATIRST